MSTLYIVVEPLTIDEQPQDSNTLLGGSAQFSVVALGEALAYQWFYNSEPLIDTDRIQGSTSPNLLISDVTVRDFGEYEVIVSNSAGSVNSNPVSLLSS